MSNEDLVRILTAYAIIEWKMSTLNFEKRFMNPYSANKLLTLLSKRKNARGN